MADDQDIAAAPDGTPPEPAATVTPRPLWQRAAKWTAIVFAGIIVLVAVLLFGLNTEPGKRFVANQIEGIAFENGMQIGIGAIEGSIYGKMVLRHVELRDPKGVFLTAPRLTVDWRPFAFIGSHVDIRALTSPLITLLRLPEFKDTPPSDQPLLPDLDIDIDTLRVDRFVADAPVSGTRRVATFAGNAHIADGRAQIDFGARTLAGAGSGGDDRLKLKLDAVPEANRLALMLDLNAPADGVIAAIAGLDAPLGARLAGRGDWQRWDGRLTADYANAPLAGLDIAARNGRFRVQGPTRIARLFDGPTAQLLGPVLDVDIGAALDARRARLTGGVGNDAFRLDTDGLVDLSGNSFEDLALDFVLTRPAAIAENLNGRGVHAALRLDGPFSTPAIDYSIAANRLGFNDMALVDLVANGDARVRTDQITIPLDARVSRITGLDTVAGGTLTDVRLSGDLAIDGARILSDNMRLRSDRIDAGLVLVADTSQGLYNGAIDGRIDDYRIQSVGAFDVRTDLDINTAPRGGFALAGRVSARSTRLFSDGVRDFLGGNAVAATDVRYGPDGVFRFRNLALRSPAVRVTGGSGSYAPDGRLTLNADGTTDAYGRVGIRVAGTISDPNAVVTAERPGLGIGLADLRAGITGAPGGYRLDATAATDYGPLRANVVLGLGERISLAIDDADLGGIGFTGRLQQTAAGPFQGRLDANGRGLGGVVRLDAAGAYQQALINLRAQNTVLDGPAQLAIGSAIVDARVILYDRPYVVADIDLAQTRIGDFNLTAAKAKIDYRDGSGHARLVAEGVSGVSFRIAANAELQPKLWRAALTGRARGITFRTASPARIIPGEQGYELLPTRIDFGKGNVRLAGRYGDGLALQSRLEALDLSLVNAFVPGLGLDGRASGSLDFEQPSAGAFPRADARLKIDDFTRTTAATVSQPVDINLVGKLLPDGGEARAVMRRRGSVIGRMVASLRPLPPGSGTWTTRLLAAPLNGGIRYNGPADTLFSFTGQTNQSLRGPIGVAADFSGRVQRPQLTGIVRANALTYRNQRYGTRLSNMALSARFAGDQLEIEQLRARAGDGTVSAQGFVSLASASGYPMNITATLDQAQLARSDAIAAEATGQLRLTKAAGENALLSGTITLPETRYQIIRQGSAEIPELTGVRFKPPKGPQRITGDEPAEPEPGLLGAVRLDVALSAPERLYVSGMGLESEWSANLNLSGTSADPRVTGNVQLVRGTLGFAGRSFELTEGRVNFVGGSAIDPTINLVATEDIEDVDVNVTITGRATDPQIAFSSVPALPQDEVLARILFGSSIGNLSTIQAVQLAASLNSLRGSGGGLNPLGKLRSATGIDRLRILGSDEATGRGTALAAGQYLTDDVYVEFITDAKGFTATQLEISLTPALSILSQAGGSGATNFNVRYRKDY